MRKVPVGTVEIDRCLSCGTLWFDPGEIRELTEGRVPAGDAGATPAGKDGEGEGSLRRMHRQAASLSCPRCGGMVSAEDFQSTGIPVFRCFECRGILTPGRSADAIRDRFEAIRAHGEQYAALGENLADAVRRRMERTYGPSPGAAPRIGMKDVKWRVPLPVIVPLADGGTPPRSLPLVTWLSLGTIAAVYLFSRLSGAVPLLPGGIPGLPPGKGFAGVSPLALFVYPFVAGGIVPLAVNALFLFVLGDNVEDRMGWLPFLLLFVACGAASGAVHLLLGTKGSPPALGPAGAVAGIIGAYLVFFPQVPLKVYRMGQVVSIPAYLFACLWVVAVLILGAGTGPVARLLDPAPLTFAASMSGFGVGVLAAILWRRVE